MNDGQHERYDRIVVGIDGSAFSDVTLEWAAHQAELTGSTLDVVTTWQYPISYGWAIPIPSDFDPAAQAATQIQGLVAAVTSAHPDVVVQTRVIEGHPAPALVEASRQADLLVVGSRGHGEFAGMLLGSVSDYCAHHSLCPIVIIHEPA